MNEKIKETKKDEIEKEIVDYIKGHRPQYKTCVLATSKDNIPRATPVMYYQEDLIIWISTEKKKEWESRKHNIEPQGFPCHL